MRKLLIALALISMGFYASSQNNSSFGLNYQYLHNAGNHGVGVSFKTRLWKNVVLLSDADYFFKNYHGIFEENFQKEYYSRYVTLNLNVGYNISLTENFNLIPYAGVGLFYENIDGYVSSDGGGSYPNYYPGYNVSIDDNITAPLANIGLLVEYYLSGHVFITGGIKGQIDIYDGTYNKFPYLTLGIGYKL